MLAAEHVAIEGRAARDQRALEARDGLDQMLEGHGRGIAGESGGEVARIRRIHRQLRAHGGLAALESELHRVLIQHRLEHLCLERAHPGPHPAEADVVSDVDQRHGVAGQRLAGGADRDRPILREGVRRFVTARAAVLAGHRQAALEEQPLTERHLGPGHGIVRRYRGRGETPRQVPGGGGEQQQCGCREASPRAPQRQLAAVPARVNAAVWPAICARSWIHLSSSSRLAALLPEGLAR